MTPSTSTGRALRSSDPLTTPARRLDPPRPRRRAPTGWASRWTLPPSRPRARAPCRLPRVPRTERPPRWWTCAAISAARRVFPICAGPETKSTRPRPRWFWRHVPRNQRISPSRSTSGVSGSSSGGGLVFFSAAPAVRRRGRRPAGDGQRLDHLDRLSKPLNDDRPRSAKRGPRAGRRDRSRCG